MTYFISYDIADAKRRYKVAKHLESYGIRVQYSFFQCDVGKRLLDYIISELLEVIDENEDSILVYPVCEDCLAKAEELGKKNLGAKELFKVA